MTPHYLIHQAVRIGRLVNTASMQEWLPDLRVVEPVPHASPMTSCALTHQAIVREAQANGHGAVVIYEDDVLFRDEAARTHWLTLVRHFHAVPEIDILLGGVSVCNGEKYYAPGLVEVKGFSATHCYCVKASGYEAILAKSPRNHIDGLITDTKLRKVVAVPFLATQLAGWSDIRQGKVDDGSTFRRTEERLLKVVRNG